VIRDPLLRPATQQAGTTKQLVGASGFLHCCSSKPDNLAAS
jgi:hypothetical protein